MAPFTSALSSSTWTTIHEWKCQWHCAWHLMELPQIPLAGQNMVGSSMKTWTALRRALPPLSVIRWSWLILSQGCQANCQACPWGSHPNLTHPQVIQIVPFSPLEMVISLLVSCQSRIDGCGGRRQHTLHSAFFREGNFIRGRQIDTCDFVLAFSPQKYNFHMWNKRFWTSLHYLTAPGGGLGLSMDPQSTGWGPYEKQSKWWVKHLVCCTCSSTLQQMHWLDHKTQSKKQHVQCKHNLELGTSHPPFHSHPQDHIFSRLWRNLGKNTSSLPNHQSQEKTQ